MSTQRPFGPFGEVLAAIMRSRGLQVSPESVRNLAIDSGIEPQDLEGEMYARGGEAGGLNVLAGDAHALTWVLSLTQAERGVFALALSRLGSVKPECITEAIGERGMERIMGKRPRPEEVPERFPVPLVRYFVPERAALRIDGRENLLPCWVGKAADYVERCPNDATMRVYGISLCAVHGEESAMGAREELTRDASDTLEGMMRPGINSALFGAYEKARLYLVEETNLARESSPALLREAFPEPPLTNDFEIPYEHLQRSEMGLDEGTPWTDWLFSTRHHTHALMRESYRRGEDDVVEHLEELRQRHNVLLSYALAIEDGLFPEHVEKVRGG